MTEFAEESYSEMESDDDILSEDEYVSTIFHGNIGNMM